MGELSARAVRFTYPGALAGQAALEEVTLTVAPGEFLGLIGPNGSGKSTLLRCLTGLLAPQGGAVLIDGQPVEEWPPGELARRLGVVPQSEQTAFEFTVEQLVAMGRYPHRRRWQRETAADRRAVAEALAFTGLTSLAQRPLGSLSGGERQRVLLARALAQEPQALLLDEVTTHLDLGYQAEILALLERLNAERGLTIVAVLHDLNLAARCCRRLVLLAQGRIVAEGTPTEVLTPDNLREAYGVEVSVRPGTDGRPVVAVESVAARRAPGPADEPAPAPGPPGEQAGEQADEQTVAQADEQAAAQVDERAAERTAEQPDGQAGRSAGRLSGEQTGVQPAPRGTIHLICGGGSGAALLSNLLAAGYEVTCGVLNRGDSDWEAARLRGLELAEEAPFSGVTPQAHQRNLELIRRAGAVVLGDVPFGPGNLANLRAAREALAEGRPVLVCDFTPIAQRDFTGGAAAQGYAELLSAGAVRIAAAEDLLAALPAKTSAAEPPRKSDEERLR